MRGRCESLPPVAVSLWPVGGQWPFLAREWLPFAVGLPFQWERPSRCGQWPKVAGEGHRYPSPKGVAGGEVAPGLEAFPQYGGYIVVKDFSGADVGMEYSQALMP